MYPRELDKKGNEYIYTWFANNRKNADRLRTLPEPVDKRLTLRGGWNKSGSGPSDSSGNLQNRCKGEKASRVAGRVKFFRADQNFGYITGEDNTDYRITLNAYNPDIQAEDLKKGRSVTFIPKNLNGKWVANQCRLAE